MQDPQLDYRSAFVDAVNTLSDSPHTTHGEEIASEQDGLSIALCVGDADVVLSHAHPQAPSMAGELDFGPLPLDGRTGALLKLLEMNHDGLSLAGGTYGVDGETGKVIYRQTWLLDRLDTQDLLDDLLAAGAQSGQWVEAWFEGLGHEADESGEAGAAGRLA